ncbi:MAG: hypothetical protein DMF68_07130 [Acidobacteria bacterium]|nr:MAG: hypothetical protein DMF68_07130 [Acidobacteriota bacterium]
MKNKLSIFFGAIILTVCAVTTALAQDVKITQRMSANGQVVSENTTYIKGTRKRTENKIGAQAGMDERVAAMMPTIANIDQCDRKRKLQINDKARKYYITPLDDAGAASTSGGASNMSSSPADTRSGGFVTYTMNITDTGERKDMFGFRARHLKITSTVDPGPGACTPKSRFEQDGWFIDFQADLSCATGGPTEARQTPGRQGCQDRIRYRYTGTGRMGYPLDMTTTIYDEQGRATTIRQEVVDLQRTTLDAALFDIPSGYTQASNMQELYNVNPSEIMAAMNNGGNNRTSDSGGMSSSGATESKRPGEIRVGVVAINNKTDRTVSTDSLREQLIGSLSGSRLTAIALDATSPSAIETEAKAKQCDFILYTDISTLKQASASKKIGGLLGRASGVGSGGVDKSEAHVDYRLIPVGGSSPQVQSSATGKEEGDQASVSTAIQQEAQTIRSKISR